MKKKLIELCEKRKENNKSESALISALLMMGIVEAYDGAEDEPKKSTETIDRVFKILEEWVATWDKLIAVLNELPDVPDKEDAKEE